MKLETNYLKIATYAEAQDLKRMSLAFFEASPYKKYGVDENRVDGLVQDFLTSDLDKLCLCLMSGNTAIGVLAAAATPNLFNNRKACIEIIWWIDPEHRGYGDAKKMVDAYEYWARYKVNAQVIQLVTLDPALGKLYKRLGFDKAEEAWIKEL